MTAAERLGIPAPGMYPSPALLRRWKSMPVWQAKRARAAWWREHGQQEDHAAPTLAPSAPERRPGTGTRLSNEELARRTARRAQLDDPAFDGTVTGEDLAIASPATVTKWMNDGTLQRDLGGPPPQKQRAIW